MDDFSTTHHVPGAFPETRIALPQKRERTTALPQIFVTPSSSLRPLDAPARSHMQDTEPPSSQGLVQFGESNDDIPLPIYPVAPRHEDCSTTQTMDSSLKVTPHFDGKLGTTRADVDAVSDELVDQPAVNASSVQDHHNPQNNTSQDCASCSSLETQNRMLKQLVREAREERDEVLSSVGSLQRWRYQVRREPDLDDHGQDLEMAVENHTAHLPIDTLYHAARNKKINTLEAKVADLTEQLHNVCRYYNMLMDEVKASSGIASTAPPARNALAPTTSPSNDPFEKAATLFALPERDLWRCATEAGSVRNDVLNRLIGLPHSDINARIAELQSALCNEATSHGKARIQFETMAKSAKKMAAAAAEEPPVSEEVHKLMQSRSNHYEYETITLTTALQASEEQVEALEQKLKAAFECTSAKSLEEALSYLDTSAKLLRQWSDQLGRLQGDLRQTAHKLDRLVISDGLVSLHWKLLDQSDRLRQAWILFKTAEVQSPRGPGLDTEESIFDYAVIAEHSHEYRTTVAAEESEDDQMGLLTAFSDTVSDGPDELVTYYTPQHFHDYRTAVAVGKPEGSQMGLSTAFSDTSSDDFDELVTYYTPQASDDEGD
ncbi:hypothetical protein D6C86_07222 [Aureobasidium pullulans]|uniref:Uncharacterized protein n=1 Tax=Aureobasidium pullulans TaxID=5580 RepID=A0A4V6TIL4_AURPU|nr:hypothetical protein D6C94_09541 [Aureobasidium pullulans]THZ36909.1 hypothetical protein D6C87_08844 [Aureobasidium pullulans]THZ57301.1 hypothetical protein D6C86_07222 [Aureobasidium pullulans]THZ65973.1 hypothetical protein D6C88_08280 [Aureobasidium pullulans]